MLKIAAQKMYKYITLWSSPGCMSSMKYRIARCNFSVPVFNIKVSKSSHLVANTTQIIVSTETTSKPIKYNHTVQLA